ncbi:hypothetical protein Tco_0693703 [Tanacetum coccineum]
MNESPLVDSGCVVLIFSLGDDLIALTTHTAGNGFSNRCSFLKLPLNHNSTRTSSNPRNQALIQDGKAGVTARVVTMLQQSGVKYICAIGNALSLETKENAQWYKDKAMVKLKLRKLEQIWMKSNSHFLVELRVSRWTRAVQQSFQTILLFRLTMLIHYDSDVLMMSSKCKNALLMAIISNYDKLINHVNNWEKANKEQNSESVPAELESKPSDASLVKIEAPKELPKIRTTKPDARRHMVMGFEHTKAVVNNEIILFLKSLKDIFNVFDKDLLNEIMEVQIVFDQVDIAVQDRLKCSTSNCRSKPTCNKRNDRISRTPKDVALRVVVLAESPVSTSIDQDAPSTSIPSTQEQEHSLNISQGFKESPKTPTFHDDLLHESLHEESLSEGSSSNVRQIHTLFEHLGRWTKDHPIANVIGNPSRSVSPRKQLQTDAM